MPWYIYLCCGGGLFLLVFFGLSVIKSRGASSNYTEYVMDENNHWSTWKDRGNYD